MSALSALVGGGADCGPSNPLAQMSKQFGNDRGVQQDHFTNQAGSSSSFRQHQQATNPDEANRFFKHGQGQNRRQQPGTGPAFDLSPLNRALTPPLWAKAFTQKEGATQLREGGSSGAEQESFRRAFSQSQAQHQHQAQQAGHDQWTGQFESNRLQQQLPSSSHSQMSNRNDQLQRNGGSSHMYRNPVAQARLYGSGFMGSSSRDMEMRNGEAIGGRGEERYNQAFVTAAQDSQWETAFLAQELTSTTSPLLAHLPLDSAVLQDQSRSPLLSDTQSRDALALTAGQLLNTVHLSEQSHAQTQTQTAEQAARNEKFSKSTFMDLMRKLRDGEVAVEGDKVVEQIMENRGAVDKGKGREDVSSAWSGDFAREEEGRVGARGLNTEMAMGGRGSDMDMGRYMDGLGNMGRGGMGMHSVGGSSLEAFNQVQADRKEMLAQQARVEQGYSEMNEMWDKDDAQREKRNENKFGATRDRKVQFQGDGGLLEQEDVEMSMETRPSHVIGAGPGWEEDFAAETIVGGHSREPVTRRTGPLSAQEREWDQLQNDWDTFEATATGIKSSAEPSTSQYASTSTMASGYSFAAANPYFGQTRTHSLHSLPPTQSTYESVLEKEAAVLENPTDSHAWLALGIKQQENEREEQAILALTRALQLDPDLREAYLALAVSYTNENERGLAYESINRWIDCLSIKEYSREIENYRDLFGKMGDDLGISEKHDYLTGMLIRLAQSRAEKDGADVDADVQIGLGVLFNTSEEYDKAGDCFESALSVRPDDPLLFNRLGATLANGGKAELAIQYYLEAIEIQPSYVRARFNLAVANMNLNQHESAAEHLITALSIQESDSEQHNGGDRGVTSGVTSQALWDSLNIALLMMHRNDLAGLCTERNLKMLKEKFPRTDAEMA